MSDTLGIGVIGCGNISAAYFRLAPLFRGIEMRACADLSAEAAAARAEEFGLRAMSVDELLSADDIDIVVNLTVPNAHFAVSEQVLKAGKARLFRKAVCPDPRGRGDAEGPGQGRRPPCRIGAGYFPWRVPSARPASRRRWGGRADFVRDLFRAGAGDGDVAPQS